jgi:hypothetical protein
MHGAQQDAAPPVHVTRRAVLRAVARRSFPRLLEATIIPALLFYVGLALWGLTGAFVAVLAWSYGATGWRLATGRRVSCLLGLATVAITVRTVLALASGSVFVYFIQPVMGTVAMAGVFFGSIVVGRPLIGNLARDFWPLQPEVADHPAVVKLFRGLTILWGCVNLLTALATYVLLVTLPIEGFVAAKTLSGYLITGTAVFLTISWSIATARREGLTRAATAGLLVDAG